MAKKETTEEKKVAKKAEKTTTKVVKDALSLTELRNKDVKALLGDLAAVRADLADARRSLAAGELVNSNVIPKYRKTIARIQTVVVEKARVTQGKEDA